MSEDVAELGIKVDSSGVIKATGNLDKLDKQSRENVQSTDKLKKSFFGLKTAAAAVAGSLVLKHFISTAASFETMKISLETVTGSAEKATIAFEGIKEFAANTPFSVEEVTQSFIKLKALGIEPTEANLRSFGNTSSAMGKSLNQMIEAVADAATGEFERLKEFGIKATKEGDRATFVFQGVKTEIGNNAKEITAFLQSIGDENFGGAMEKQMDTANGAFSNFGDAVDNLSDALGEAGLTQVIKTTVQWMTSLVNSIADFVDGDSPIEKLTNKLEKARSEAGRAQDGSQYKKVMDAAVLRYEAELEGLRKVNKEKKNGIDEAGAGGGEEKRAAEIAAEETKNETLLATAANFQELHKAQALQAKMTEDEEIAALQMLADEQVIVARQLADNEAMAAAERMHKDRNQAIGQTFATLAVLTASSSKKMFKIGKAASIVSAIINTHEAITKTMAATPYPWNIPLAIAQGAAGLVQVQNIKSQQFSGQAHDGMDYIPRTGSYILEQGEAVIKKQEAGKIRAGDVGGGGGMTFAPVIQAFDAEEVGQKNDKLFVGMRNSFIDWMDEEGLKFS